MPLETLSVNHVEYKIEKLLGKGKGGYSYLVSKDGKKYVLKQIHLGYKILVEDPGVYAVCGRT